MHGVLLTFTNSAPIDDIAEPLSDYCDAVRGIPGLISKTWIQDGDTLGGFHVFADRESADTYLASEMAAGLMSMEPFSDFEVRQFGIFDDFSVRNGTPSQVLAGSAG